MRSRGFILTGMALLIWLLLPSVVAAEEPKPERDPRFNGTYDRLGQKPHDHEAYGYREETVPGSFHWVRSSGVDARSQRINRFRSVHGGVIWRARAFGASTRRAHGFRGRRGHGRRW